MTNDTLLESSCAILLEFAKKFANLQKFNFFVAKFSYKQEGGVKLPPPAGIGLKLLIR